MARRPGDWTTGEDRILLASLKLTRRGIVQKLAEAGYVRTFDAVSSRLRYHRVALKDGRPSKWDHRHDQFLLAHYGKKPIHQIASEMTESFGAPISRSQVSHHAASLGITRGRAEFTGPEITAIRGAMAVGYGIRALAGLMEAAGFPRRGRTSYQSICQRLDIRKTPRRVYEPEDEPPERQARSFMAMDKRFCAAMRASPEWRARENV